MVDLGLVFALLSGAVALRVGALAPPGLYLDDSWPALVVKADTLHEVLLAGAWAPGFSVLLKGWLSTLGFSELNAQLLPFLFGVLAPPALYVACRLRGLERLPSVVGGFVLLTSPIHSAYSARVKHYTLDTLCVVVVLLAVWWLLDDVRARRRWWVATVTVGGAIAFSAQAAVVAGAAGTVVMVALLREDRRAAPVAFGAATSLAVFAGGWWWFLLRPRVTETLRQEFRARFFGIEGGIDDATVDLARATWSILWGALSLPGFAEALVAAAAAGIVLWKRPWLGLILLAPFGLAAVLAALRMAPLGGGRTDIYLYPLVAALVAIAVAEFSLLARRVTLFVVSTLGVASIVTVRAPEYPAEVVRPLVASAEARARRGDGVLVHTKARYPFALYTRLPVDLLASGEFQTGFDVRVHGSNVFLLKGTPSEPVRETIQRLARTHDSVWLLASHDSVPVRVLRVLAEHGYIKTFDRREEGASLGQWTRSSYADG